MSSTHGYHREGFLSEFVPDAADRAQVETSAQRIHSFLKERVGQPLGSVVI